MKVFKSYLILLVLSLVGCGISVGKNPLEDAVNPFDGSKEKWFKYKDEGGLQKEKIFYGLKTSSVEVQWRQDGRISFVLLMVNGYSPKDIRAALNKACKTSDEDWKKREGTITSGVAKNGNIKCEYFTTDTSSSFDVSIIVNN